MGQKLALNLMSHKFGLPRFSLRWYQELSAAKTLEWRDIDLSKRMSVQLNIEAGEWKMLELSSTML